MIPTPTKRALIGPLLIAMSSLAMLIWSWGTWPDPLIDYGTHLYVPWQLIEGRVLYRDIAYYNGPFSPYFNALMFAIGGVSIRTLVIVNLVILTAAMALAYHLTTRASSHAAAIAGGIAFALIFGFGQVVLIGNYNWVTPYAHELTHGVVLGLAAIACIHRYHRTGHARWIAVGGALLGAVFLTKAEPAAAAFPAVVAQLISGWWCSIIDRKTIARAAILLIISILIFPTLAWVLLTMAMPCSQAFRGVLGSWPWVFDRRVTALLFYRKIVGLDDVTGNLATMLRWCGVYVALIGSAVGIGLLIRASNKTAARLVPPMAFLLLFVPLLIGFNQINWTGMLTPLPVCLCGAMCVVTAEVVRRKIDAGRAALRGSLVIFSIMLLAKMGLKPHAYHYGFVLAWPGTIVLVSIITTELPAWIASHGGNGNAVRAVGLAAGLVATLFILNRDLSNFGSKQWTVTPGTPDAFRANTCGLEVQQVCDEIRRLVPVNGTVAVFPQGLMINYLTRRCSPIPNVNFMPPEVLAAGEDTFITALQKHPPDLIIVTSTVVQDEHFTLDGEDAYGATTLKWIQQNYQPIDVVTLPKPLPTIYRFIVSRRRVP